MKIIYDSIYRQWIWADLLRNHFHKTLPKKTQLKNQIFSNDDFTLEPFWIFLSLWYSILFSVLEVLKNNKIKIKDINKEINFIYPILKRYRNAVFHIQKKYWNDKWRDLILQDKTADIIIKVHKRIGEFLLNNLTK